MIRRLARSLLNLLSQNQKYFLLRELSNQLSIVSMAKTGEIGDIEGSPNDWTIFRRYVHGIIWETDTSDVCVNFFDKFGHGTFVDIGANIGMIFIPVLSRSGCAGLGVEASPFNFSCLRDNCSRNLPPNSVRLLNIAVGDHNGPVQFNVNTVNFGDHRVSVEGELTVDCRRFDDAISDMKLMRPILAKVDIQGSELRFFYGAKEFLKNADAMVLEYSPFDQNYNDCMDEYDKILTENFAAVGVMNDFAQNEIPKKHELAKLNQQYLDNIKTRIRMRKWRDLSQGHENLFLLKI